LLARNSGACCGEQPAQERHLVPLRAARSSWLVFPGLVDRGHAAARRSRSGPSSGQIEVEKHGGPLARQGSRLSGRRRAGLTRTDPRPGELLRARRTEALYAAQKRSRTATASSSSSPSRGRDVAGGAARSFAGQPLGEERSDGRRGLGRTTAARPRASFVTSSAGLSISAGDEDVAFAAAALIVSSSRPLVLDAHATSSPRRNVPTRGTRCPAKSGPTDEDAEAARRDDIPVTATTRPAARAADHGAGIPAAAGVVAAGGLVVPRTP